MQFVVLMIAAGAARRRGAAIVLVAGGWWLVAGGWWLVGAAAVCGMYRGGHRMWLAHRARSEQRSHQRAELLARAELQHRWYLDGDPRGTYGRYTPAA